MSLPENNALQSTWGVVYLVGRRNKMSETTLWKKIILLFKPLKKSAAEEMFICHYKEHKGTQYIYRFEKIKKSIGYEDSK